MRRSWASLTGKRIKELAEVEFGHVVAVLITSIGFLLFLVSAIPVGGF